MAKIEISEDLSSLIPETLNYLRVDDADMSGVPQNVETSESVSSLLISEDSVQITDTPLANNTNKFYVRMDDNSEEILFTNKDGSVSQRWISNDKSNQIEMGSNAAPTVLDITGDGLTLFLQDADSIADSRFTFFPGTFQLYINNASFQIQIEATQIIEIKQGQTGTDTVLLSDDNTTSIEIRNNKKLALGAISTDIGLYGKTPVAQATTGITPAAFVANSSGIADDTATFGGYTLGQMAAALIAIGISQ